MIVCKYEYYSHFLVWKRCVSQKNLTRKAVTTMSITNATTQRDFDKNAVAEIQRQILQIKLFEFFKNEQLGLNADNFNLDTNTKWFVHINYISVVIGFLFTRICRYIKPDRIMERYWDTYYKKDKERALPTQTKDALFWIFG